MKLDLLMKAINHCIVYGGANFDDNEKEDLVKAYAECVATDERYANIDLYNGSVSLITDPALDRVLNHMTYDVLGKRMRAHNGHVPFEYYAHDVRRDVFFTGDLTNDQLMLGYEVLSSLWLDNEQAGDHRSDGTFKSNEYFLGTTERMAIRNLCDMALIRYRDSNGEIDYAELGELSPAVLEDIRSTLAD